MIRLERNYRSTAHILAAASHLIAHNEGRLGKTLRTEDEPGEKVGVTGAWDSEEEARAIGEEIEAAAARAATRSTRSRSWCAPRSRCASSRTASSRSACPTASSAARASTSARKSATRSPICAWSTQPADDLAFERIVNVPKRGLGDATVQAPARPCAQAPRAAAGGRARASSRPTSSSRSRAARCATSSTAFDRWRAQKDTLPHTELAEIVLDESGYTEMWQKDRSADAAGRLENLKELVRSMEEFENLQGFLEHISLVMDAEQAAPRPTRSRS